MEEIVITNTIIATLIAVTTAILTAMFIFGFAWMTSKYSRNKR